MFDCASASTLPIVIVNVAMMAMTSGQSTMKSPRPGRIASMTRSSTAKPAAFEAVDRKPATGVGAP